MRARGLFSRLDREETTCSIKLGRQEIRFVVHGKTLNRSGGEERRVLKFVAIKIIRPRGLGNVDEMQRHAGDCVSENSTGIVVPGSVVRRFKIGIKLGYIPSDPFRKWFSACNHCAIRARRVSYSACIYI